MRASSDIYPDKYLDLGKQKQVNYNIIEKQDEDGNIQYYYDVLYVEEFNKKEIIKELIREKYDHDDEIALINNYNEDPDEYNDEYSSYQEYRKECKKISDEIIYDFYFSGSTKNIEIIMPEIYVLKSPDTGNELFDQQVYDYRDNLLTWGCRIFRNENNIICRVNDSVKITIEDFLFIMSKDGGNIKNFDPYVKIHKDDIDNKIPDGLPYSDDKTKNTWRTWRNDNNSLDEPIENYYYFKSSTFDETLTGDELMLIYDSTDATLVNNK